MVSSKIFALFAIAFIVVSVNAAPAEIVDVDADDFELTEDEERGLQEWATTALKAAAVELSRQAWQYVADKAKKVNWVCFKEIYDTCDINPIKHPKDYYECGKTYFLEHFEHCYHGDE